ncbi:MAG: response regulator transcription factor [Terrimicrobiaceae bacterium]|nr:response regulator transcription factor [Terrimicrobiaceae bacterium]
MSQSVLVVEDEADVADLVRYNLARAGFEVKLAADGPGALEAVSASRPDAVILDLMLPGMSGFEVCRRIRKHPGAEGVAILMLTAKSETAEKVRGLELGADDYITKPFSPKELVLRLQAVLRRLKAPAAGAGRIEAAGLELDRSTMEVRLDGARLDLTAIEFRLLNLLVERRGRTQSRESLLLDVWGYNSSVDTRTVDTHIRRLREKLGSRSSWLETVRGEGYRFRSG